MLLLFRNFLKFSARLLSIYFVRDEPGSNFGQDSVFLTPFSEMPAQKHELLHEVVLQWPSQFNFCYPILRRYIN